jgi:hypothetical protein
VSLDANSRKLLDLFQKKLFRHGACEESFSKLCENGCSKQDLALLLFAASTAAVAGQSELLDTGGLSTVQLTRLRRDLISIAGLVERVNSSVLNPKFDLLWAPPDVARDPLRETLARLYDILPRIMQTYAAHLDQFSKFTKANLKRMTFAHFYALKLLRYTQEHTGKPRYDDSANLLTSGFLAAGGAEDNLPGFFTAEALAKLNQRTVKLR